MGGVTNELQSQIRPNFQRICPTEGFRQQWLRTLYFVRKGSFWKDADAGHYVNRKHMSLRFDEKNVNLQCRSCNRFDEGNMIGYNHGLIEKYGDKVISYLDIKRHNISKIGPTEYTVLIKHYQQEVKRLKEQKGL